MDSAVIRSFDSGKDALGTTFKTSIDPKNDGITSRPEGANTLALTASGLVYTGACLLEDIIIVSHTVGATVRVSDALTATTPYLSSAMATHANHIAGSSLMGSCAKKMSTGIYITITGTIEILVKYIPLTQAHNNS